MDAFPWLVVHHFTLFWAGMSIFSAAPACFLHTDRGTILFPQLIESMDRQWILPLFIWSSTVHDSGTARYNAQPRNASHILFVIIHIKNGLQLFKTNYAMLTMSSLYRWIRACMYPKIHLCSHDGDRNYCFHCSISTKIRHFELMVPCTMKVPLSIIWIHGAKIAEWFTLWDQLECVILLLKWW